MGGLFDCLFACWLVLFACLFISLCLCLFVLFVEFDVLIVCNLLSINFVVVVLFTVVL